MRVAGENQLAAQGFRRQRRALLEEKCVSGDEARRGQPVKRRGDRHHRDIEGCVRDLIERGEALRYQVLMRGKTVVRQGFPVRQQEHAQVGREEGQLHAQAFSVLCGLGQDQQRPDAAQKRGERQGVGGFVQEWKCRACARSGGGVGQLHRCGLDIRCNYSGWERLIGPAGGRKSAAMRTGVDQSCTFKRCIIRYQLSVKMI